MISAERSLQITFLMGPPGAGKSSLAPPINSTDIDVIDPDAFKILPGAFYHEQSIQKAIETLVNKLKNQNSRHIIYQGSGAWYPYIQELIDRVKTIQPTAHISFLFVVAPLTTCISRVQNRIHQTGQEVPLNVVIQNHRLATCLLPEYRRMLEGHLFGIINTEDKIPRLIHLEQIKGTLKPGPFFKYLKKKPQPKEESTSPSQQ